MSQIQRVMIIADVNQETLNNMGHTLESALNFIHPAVEKVTIVEEDNELLTAVQLRYEEEINTRLVHLSEKEREEVLNNIQIMTEDHMNEYAEQIISEKEKKEDEQ
jgi:hypothetical protein